MRRIPFITIFFLSVLLWSCNNTPTEVQVLEKYADQKPRHTKEYKIKEDGTKVLDREVYYFPEEKKYIEGSYNEEEQKDGRWTSWYANGKKNSEGTYKKGQLTGKYTVWHDNGEVFYKGRYQDDKEIGMWRFYDTNGVLIKEIDYDKK